MYHFQPQALLERVEIVVAVQKSVAGHQAESGNPTVDCLADGITLRPQRAVVPSGFGRQFDASSREHMESQKLVVNLEKHAWIAHPLQDFAQDQVCQSQALPLQRTVEPCCFWVGSASQVVDPHSRIDDDHIQLCAAVNWKSVPGGTR